MSVTNNINICTHTHTHNTNLKSCSRGSLRTVCAENDQYLHKRELHGLSNYRWTYVGVLQTNIWKTSRGAWLYNCEIDFLSVSIFPTAHQWELQLKTTGKCWIWTTVKGKIKWHSIGQIKQVNRRKIVYLRFGPMPEKKTNTKDLILKIKTMKCGNLVFLMRSMWTKDPFTPRTITIKPRVCFVFIFTLVYA